MTHDTSTAFKLKQEISVQLQILALLGIKSMQGYDKAFHISWTSLKLFVVVVVVIQITDFFGISHKFIQIWLTHTLFAFTEKVQRAFVTIIITQDYIHRWNLCFICLCRKQCSDTKAVRNDYREEFKNLIHWLSCHSQSKDHNNKLRPSSSF